MNTRYILVLLFVPTLMQATLFSKAQRLFEEHKFEKALQAYKGIRKKDAAVWYNMGNTAYALQDNLHALIYWLRAEKYSDAHIYTCARHNIDILNQQTGMNVPSLLKQLQRWLRSLSKTWPVNWWQLLSIILWCILLWLLLCYTNRRLKGICVGITLIAFLFSLSVVAVAYTAQKELGVVTESSKVYNGPNDAFYTLDEIPQGAVVRVQQCEQAWLKITHDLLTGWVKQETVSLV